VSGIQKALLSKGIRLYATLLWSSHPTSIDAEDFQNVAKNTGGFVVNEAALPFQDGPFSWKEKYDVSPGHRANLAAAADMLYGQLFGAYQIEIRTSTPVERAKRLKVEVVDGSGGKRKGVTLSYPKQLAACSAEVQK
jgi:hypothetical protein